MEPVIPILQTAHVSLVPIKPADAPILHRIYQQDGVLKYFPGPGSVPLEKVERWVKLTTEHWEKYAYGNWGILPEGETEIAGWAGLQYLPELDQTEVGYLLSPAFWGRGYATEVALASLQFGFEHFPLERIIALVHEDNLASRRVIEKCKMQYVDTITLWGMQLLRSEVHRSEFLEK